MDVWKAVEHITHLENQGVFLKYVILPVICLAMHLKLSPNVTLSYYSHHKSLSLLDLGNPLSVAFLTLETIYSQNIYLHV